MSEQGDGAPDWTRPGLAASNSSGVCVEDNATSGTAMFQQSGIVSLGAGGLAPGAGDASGSAGEGPADADRVGDGDGLAEPDEPAEAPGSGAHAVRTRASARTGRTLRNRSTPSA